MKEECSGCEKGKVYKLINFNHELYVKGPNYPSEMCSCQEKWKKVEKLVPKKKAEWSIRNYMESSSLCHNDKPVARFTNRTLARRVAKWLNEGER